MSKITALAVAIVVALGGAITAVVVRSEPPGYELNAMFTKTIGLFEESDVKVLGVSVGKVTGIRPTGTQVNVVMRIHPAIKIPQNAIAAIVPISLISDRYIQLSPPYQSGPRLEPGATLSSSQTRVPAELDEVLSSLEKLFRALEAGRSDDPGALSDAIDNLASALEGTGSDLDQTLGSAGAISRVINEHSAELDSLVAGLIRVLSALAERRDQIATLNRDLSAALGAVAEEQSGLAGTLSALALLTEQVGGLIKDHRSELETDITTLSKTTSAAIRQQDSLVRNYDWLHVLAKAAEQTEDGKGFVHKQSNGLFHVDVRDTHGTASCPIPFLGCQIAASFPAASQENARENGEPTFGPRLLATPWPLPLEDLTPVAPESTATGNESQADSSGVVEVFFTKLGDLISRLWGKG